MCLKRIYQKECFKSEVINQQRLYCEYLYKLSVSFEACYDLDEVPKSNSPQFFILKKKSKEGGRCGLRKGDSDWM